MILSLYINIFYFKYKSSSTAVSKWISFCQEALEAAFQKRSARAGWFALGYLGWVCVRWSAKWNGEPPAKPLALVWQLPSGERHWTKIGVECCWNEYIGLSSLENGVSSGKTWNVFAEHRKMSDRFSFISAFLPKYLANLLFFPSKEEPVVMTAMQSKWWFFWGKWTFYPVPVFKWQLCVRSCPSVEAHCEAAVEK